MPGATGGLGAGRAARPSPGSQAPSFRSAGSRQPMRARPGSRSPQQAASVAMTFTGCCPRAYHALVPMLLGIAKRLLVGLPVQSDRLSQTLLPKRIALPVFASDAL